MVKYFFYINYGAGFVNITPEDLGASIDLVRGVLNEFIQRKELKNSFKLIKDEADAAKVYFIDNGSYEAPIKIYENGTDVTGVLKYEGFVQIKGSYDFDKRVITLSSFRSSDKYSDFIAAIGTEFQGQELASYGNVFSRFYSQNEEPNTGELNVFQYNGTSNVFQKISTSPLAVPDIGRCDSCQESGEIVVIDAYTGILKSYIISGTEWIEKRSFETNIGGRNPAIAANGSGTIKLVWDSGSLEEDYAFSGANTFVQVGTTSFIQDVSWPSIASLQGIVLITDELMKGIGYLINNKVKNIISIGDIKRPQIRQLNPLGAVFVFVDSYLKQLRTYSIGTGSIVQIGNSFIMSGYTSIALSVYSTTQVILHDAVTGKLEMLQWDGTDWSKISSTYTFIGGYMSTVSVFSSNIMIAASGNYMLYSQDSNSIYGYINSIIDDLNLWGPSPKYELPTTIAGNGSTVDLERIRIAEVSAVTNNILEIDNTNFNKYDLKYFLDLLTLTQNYWYIDDDNKLKFIQPALFSSIGIDIDVSQYADSLNQRNYNDGFNINFEDLKFNNSYDNENTGAPITYNRNNALAQDEVRNITTDLQIFVDVLEHRNTQKIDNSGRLMMYQESNVSQLISSGIGEITGDSTRNNQFTKSKIFVDFWTDYRYSNTANFDINGVSTPVGSTVRPIIEFPDVSFSLEQVGLSEIPDSVASLDWGGGLKSYITRFSVNLKTRIVTVSSVLLDI